MSIMWLRIFAGLLTLLCAGNAAASLGAMAASIPTEALQLRGAVEISSHGRYRLHEIRLPSGTLLREFADSGGRIFAVAWNGPAAPDLRLALGTYFDSFVAGARKINRTNHSRLEVTSGSLVVQSSGHPRALSGRAYLAAAIPAGVNLDDIR